MNFALGGDRTTTHAFAASVFPLDHKGLTIENEQPSKLLLIAIRTRKVCTSTVRLHLYSYSVHTRTYAVHT